MLKNRQTIKVSSLKKQCGQLKLYGRSIKVEELKEVKLKHAT